MQLALSYEVVHSSGTEWAAEAMDLDQGDCYRVLFIGPDAEARAKDYADWKNGAGTEKSA